MFECTSEKGIDAQEILLGMGFSSYLCLIWLLQQWDKADDLWNRPGVVALLIDRALAYALPVVWSGIMESLRLGRASEIIESRC